jgi:uncharacterized DUF497 family protein
MGNKIRIMICKQYDFDPDKNKWLKEKRNISFEEVILAIEEDHLIDTIDHPNQGSYAGQRMYVIDISGYIYLVPFVRKSESCVFLKTIFRSRKMTKIYLGKEEIS